MIISDAYARWLEIQLYDYAKHIYDIKHNTLDIYVLAEAISRMSGADPDKIKKAIKLVQMDNYYAPTERERIVLAVKNGVSQAEIARMMNITRQGVNNKLKRYEGTFVALPRFGIDITYELNKFIPTYNKINPTGF